MGPDESSQGLLLCDSFMTCLWDSLVEDFWHVVSGVDVPQLHWPTGSGFESHGATALGDLGVEAPWMMEPSRKRRKKEDERSVMEVGTDSLR